MLGGNFLKSFEQQTNVNLASMLKTISQKNKEVKWVIKLWQALHSIMFPSISSKFSMMFLIIFLCVPNVFLNTIVDLLKSLSYEECGGEYHNFLIIVGSMFINI